MGPTKRRRATPLALLALLTVFLIAGTQNASAGRTWCYRDPVLSVDGLILNVLVAGEKAVIDATTEPVAVVVRVPAGVAVEQLGADDGFGEGYDVAVEHVAWLVEGEQHIQVEVDVYVPAGKKKLDVKVELGQGNSGVVTD